jgi:hypothetical protein
LRDPLTGVEADEVGGVVVDPPKLSSASGR